MIKKKKNVCFVRINYICSFNVTYFFFSKFIGFFIYSFYFITFKGNSWLNFIPSKFQAVYDRCANCYRTLTSANKPIQTPTKQLSQKSLSNHSPSTITRSSSLSYSGTKSSPYTQSSPSYFDYEDQKGYYQSLIDKDECLIEKDELNS